MSKENWKPVVGYEDAYEVSDQGRVRSLDRVVKTRNGFRNFQGRILTPSSQSTGHLQVSLSLPGKSRKVFVHHLVLETFVGLRPEGTETCHHDDDPANNKLANLRWDNRQSNIDDRARNGKTKRTAVVRSDGKKFDQILEAAKGDTCLVGNITAVCKGRRERAGGFGWTYA